MYLVKITEKKIDIDDSTFGKRSLYQGKVYLTYESLAQKIVDRKWGRIVGDKEALNQLPREALRPNDRAIKVLVFFSGGLGDAISVAILFNLLRKEYNLHIDFVCHYDIWQYIMAPLGVRGRRLSYPVESEEINRYDYIQTDLTDFIEDKSRRWERSIPGELSNAYHIDLAEFHADYSIPEDIVNSMKLSPTNSIRVGLDFESKGKVRNYPDDLANRLISMMLGLHFEVYRFGLKQSSSGARLDTDGYHDYSGSTDLFEMAALLQQMDLVIGVDSLPVHLANLFGIKTIVLLSTTRPGVFRCHKNVIPIASEIDCTPCGAIRNECPNGYEECRAFYHPSISPEGIIGCAIQECSDTLALWMNKPPSEKSTCQPFGYS